MSTVSAAAPQVNMGRAALKLAEKDFPILPLCWPAENGACGCGRGHSDREAGKAPLLPRGHLDASADPAVVRRWWSRWPEANIGVALAPARLLVIDCDSKDAVEEAETLGLPPGPRVRTGGGGLQVWTRRVSGVFERRTHLGESGKIDVLSDGYVVTPPSQHRSGRRYAWETLGRIEPAPRWAVDWLRKAVRQHEGPTASAPKDAELRAKHALEKLPGDIRELHATVPQEDRSGLAYRLACKAVESGVTDRLDVAAVVLTSAAHQAKFAHRADSWRDALRVADRALARVQKPSATGVRPRLVRLSEVESEEPRWLWKPYLPLRKIINLIGDGGLGKTLIALDWCARVTIGAPFPTAPPFQQPRRKPANVVYLTAEDGLADTLRPRFDAAGGNARRFFVLQAVRLTAEGEQIEEPVALSNLELLAEALEQVRPSLVVVDPVQGFLGASVDMHRANEVRPVLLGLAHLAERYDCGLLLIHHLSKTRQDRTIYRGLGSIDFYAAARSVLLTGRDPNNEETRALVHLKSNLAAQGPSLEYRITGDPPSVKWLGASDLTAQDVLAPDTDPEDRSAIQEAAEFLRETLRDGPMDAKDVQRAARRAGISAITLKRAKRVAGVLSSPVHGPNTGRLVGWTWALPEDRPPKDAR